MAEGVQQSPACRGQEPPPQQSQIGPQQQMHKNWSHFKSEFSSKLEEDVEVHLLMLPDDLFA